MWWKNPRQPYQKRLWHIVCDRSHLTEIAEIHLKNFQKRICDILDHLKAQAVNPLNKALKNSFKNKNHLPTGVWLRGLLNGGQAVKKRPDIGRIGHLFTSVQGIGTAHRMPPLSIMSIAGFGEIGLIELDDQGDLCGASGLPLAHILATRVGPVDHLIAIGKVGAGLDGNGRLYHRSKASRHLAELQTHIRDHLVLHQRDGGKVKGIIVGAEQVGSKHPVTGSTNSRHRQRNNGKRRFCFIPLCPLSI